MYSSGWHSSRSRLYIGVGGAGLGSFGFVVLALVFQDKYATNQLTTFDSIGLILGMCLMGWFVLFASRPIVLQTIRCCFSVELTDTRVIGQTIFGKRITLDYANIEKIIAITRYSFLRANILLVAEDGHELEIHHNIDYLGDCIEDIRKRCPNLKMVDFKGLDNDPHIWSAGNKHAML